MRSVVAHVTIVESDKVEAIIFFYFLFYRSFLQQVRVAGRNKNKIHSDHFPNELKSKETQFCVSLDFNSIGKRAE